MKNTEFTFNISDLMDTEAEAVYSCAYTVQQAEPQNGIFKSYNEVYSLDLLGIYDGHDNLLDVDSALQGAIETLALNYVGKI